VTVDAIVLSSTEYDLTITRHYWTELCFIKWPTIARDTSGLSLATFWNSANTEDSDAPGCFSIRSTIRFSAAVCSGSLADIAAR
jgi:hypothetical protein